MNLPRRTITKMIETILWTHEHWHGPIYDSDVLIDKLEDVVLQCAEIRRTVEKDKNI